MAALRSCATSGCLELVLRGHCARHAPGREQRRGSAHRRGYTAYWHQVFRPSFISLLVQAGISPVCGAALPDGPVTAHSRCQADGLLTGVDLHFHHEPPLTERERLDRAAVCDPRRIQLLCRSCHNAIEGAATVRVQ
jgi:hypothetical protein